jgi:oxygen-independent coproporphyrinogen-3 oxidase
MEQVQADLIFGVRNLPVQRSLRDEIVQLENAGATGVSCYLLTIEESTPFANEENSSDEKVEAEYLEILSTCESLGFHQHETSNFSRFAPVHNRLYWYGLPYLGLGTGAHGLLPADEKHRFGKRYRVGPSVLNRVAGDDVLPFASDAESLFSIDFYEGERTPEIVVQELLLTLLRTSAGLPLRWLNLVFGETELKRLWEDARVRRAIDSGQIELTETHLKLSAGERLRGDSWSVLVVSLLCP